MFKKKLGREIVGFAIERRSVIVIQGCPTFNTIDVSRDNYYLYYIILINRKKIVSYSAFVLYLIVIAETKLIVLFVE